MDNLLDMDNLEKAIEWLDNLPADQRDAIERLLDQGAQDNDTSNA